MSERPWRETLAALHVRSVFRILAVVAAFMPGYDGDGHRMWWHDTHTLLLDPEPGADRYTERELGYAEMGVFCLTLLMTGYGAALLSQPVPQSVAVALVQVAGTLSGITLLLNTAYCGLDAISIQYAATAPADPDPQQEYAAGEIDEAEMEERIKDRMEVSD